MDCLFCERALEDNEIRAGSDLAAAFPDAYPVSSGHTLVVPRRHVADYFDLEDAERQALWQLVDEVRERLDEGHAPDGYNLGVNVGRAAGQTVEHVHIHVIPRYDGDVDDPRGGVRWVLPDRARWWEA